MDLHQFESRIDIKPAIAQSYRIYCFLIKVMFDSRLTDLFINRVEKYRPNSLEDLISHKDIITTSKKQLRWHSTSGPAVITGYYTFYVEEEICWSILNYETLR